MRAKGFLRPENLNKNDKYYLIKYVFIVLIWVNLGFAIVELIPMFLKLNWWSHSVFTFPDILVCNIVYGLMALLFQWKRIKNSHGKSKERVDTNVEVNDEENSQE